jgi:dynein assembly factor 2
MTGPDGKRGTNWTLPYRVSKLMHQQDNNKKLCSLYDVVFSSDVIKFLVHPDFKKFVADTAIDGVSRVLQQDKEKISSDYKIMKNMNCKGGEPSLMTIKIETENPLLSNIDIDKTKTKQ